MQGLIPNRTGQPSMLEAWQHAVDEARALELGTEVAASAIDAAIEKLKAGYDDTILIGGPPCQAYSLVGRARAKGKVGYVPEEDERHYLFREYIRVLDKLRPAAFVMENVKGMLSSTVESRLVFEMLMEDLVLARYGSGPSLRIACHPGRGWQSQPAGGDTAFGFHRARRGIRSAATAPQGDHRRHPVRLAGQGHRDARSLYQG
jgi:hypothetical protein